MKKLGNKNKAIGKAPLIHMLLSPAIGLFLLGVLGRIVISDHLARLTSLSSISITQEQYILAGLSVLIVVVAAFLIAMMPYYGLGFVGTVIIWGVVKLIFRHPQLQKRYLSHPTVARNLHAIGTIASKLNTLVAICGTVLPILFVAVTYGGTLYKHIPATLGGSAPVEVVLVFKSPQSIHNPNWSFNINPLNPYQSMPVELIFESSDELWIYSQTNNTVSIMNKEEIQGRIGK